MKKTKLPTASEFYDEYTKNKLVSEEEIMIEFGKLCAKVAVEKAANNSFDKNNHYIERSEEDKDSILNAFDLNEIK